MGFIDFTLKDQSFLDYKNLYSANDYEKNDQNNTKMFSITKNMEKIMLCCLSQV